MSSTPVIACSSGPATVSAITFGFAPGYTARTTTVGGTTSGYSEIGNDGIDIKPAIRISADSTPANTGLEMKNWERFMGCLEVAILFFPFSRWREKVPEARSA